MTLLGSVERRYGRYVPTNLTSYLIIGQIIAYIVTYTTPEYTGLLPLSGKLLFAGQWWRLLTFLFTPLTQSLLFAAFAWYIFYLYAATLETRWGSFRFFLYLALSYLGSILCAFLFPGQIITNGYMYTSLFLAFAYLYPDVQLMLFFIIPVKVKWLGILTWIGIGSTVLFGPLPAKVLALLSVGNFFLFFGRDLLPSHEVLPLVKHPVQSAARIRAQEGARNVCAVCGKYEMDHLDLEFRYCSDCEPITCYCMDHLENHTHKT